MLAQSSPQHRLGRLVECVKAAQPKLLGRNKAIGSVYGELFGDEAELKLSCGHFGEEELFLPHFRKAQMGEAAKP